MRPFSKDDWSYALQELKKPRCLTFGALVCALSIALGSFYLVVGSNLRIYLTFIVKSLGCAVYGPIVGAIVAFLSDTIGFLLFPSGPYFPGYLLSEILAACIYSLFLYRERFHWLRALAAKMLINYLINVLLGCLWSYLLYGKTYLYYLTTSLIKNTLLQPIEVIIMTVVFSMLRPFLTKYLLVPRNR